MPLEGIQPRARTHLEDPGQLLGRQQLSEVNVPAQCVSALDGFPNTAGRARRPYQTPSQLRQAPTMRRLMPNHISAMLHVVIERPAHIADSPQAERENGQPVIVVHVAK